MLNRNITTFVATAWSAKVMVCLVFLLAVGGCAQLSQTSGAIRTLLATTTDASIEAGGHNGLSSVTSGANLPTLEADTSKGPSADEDLRDDTKSVLPAVFVDSTPGSMAGAIKHKNDKTVFGLIRSGWGIEPLPDNIQADADVLWAGRRDFVERSLLRVRQILPMVVDEVRRRGLPTELALLPVLESGYQSHAKSSAGAVGPFQFMVGTGRDYGLHDSRLVKMRSDYVASTRAALDYLTRLHVMFGDWHLAVAAYNWGEGNISKAIQRNVRLGLPTTFESLSLPTETRAYVPGLLGIKHMVDRPELSGLNVDSGVAPTLNQVRKVGLGGKDIDMVLVSKWTGLHESALLQLNPGVHGGLVVASATPALLLPMDAARSFDEASAKFIGQRAKYTAYVVAAGERLAHIGKKVGTKVHALRAINGIPANQEPKPNSTILVPRLAHANQDISWTVATSAHLETQPTSTRWHKSTVKRKLARGRHEHSANGTKHIPHAVINQVSAAARSRFALARNTVSLAALCLEGEMTC